MRKVSPTLLIIAFVLIHVVSFGQTGLEKADKLFKSLEFREAADLYREALTGDAEDVAILIKLADSYFMMGDYINARNFYQQVYRMEENSMPEMKFLRLVLTLKASGMAKQGNALLEVYYQDDKAKQRQLVYQKDQLKAQAKANFEYIIWPLFINSPESDFAPMFYQGDLVFASSRRTGGNNKKLYSWNKQPYLDLYLAKEAEKGQDLEQVVPFQQGDGFEFHEASVCFSSDYQTVYFTQNHVKNGKLQVNDDGLSTMRILKGTMEGNRIVAAEPLPFNDPAYSCGHPFLDPKGEYLFFSSDMPGGYGQSDLYKVQILPNGGFGDPINLGPEINTAGREMFPFLMDDKLYFSSDGHFGMGGLDIFEATTSQESGYITPVNMGEPVNSPSDDFSLIIDDSGEAGYFASNRADSDGDDDIFYFRKLAPEPVHDLFGRIFNMEDSRPVSSVTVRVYDGKRKLLSESVTDIHGSYQLKLPPEEAYTIEFSRDGYTSSDIVLTPERSKPYTYTRQDMYLLPLNALTKNENGIEKLKVNPIYFVTNKSTLTILAKQELDKVIYTLKNFPKIRIRIEAHTDSRGGKKKNQLLSQGRADEVRGYLVNGGVHPDRITASEGFGESRLLNECEDGVSCSDEEHEVNRRCDFIVVKK